MTGATITATDVVPNLNMKLIYFTVTLDGSANADFSDYSAVDFVSARDASTLAPEDATAYTAGGDITFTNSGNAIQGIAIVEL